MQLLDITYYENLEEFFEKNKGGNFYYFSTKAPHRHTDLAYPDNCYLLFGKETAGLPEKLLFDNPDTTVRIPMIGEARSLNLSNSVAVGVYEVLRQWGDVYKRQVLYLCNFFKPFSLRKQGIMPLPALPPK